MEERIMAAGVRLNDHLHWLRPPARHHHILNELARLVGDRVHAAEQGFLTTSGRFVDRKRAKEIAVAAGQVQDGGLRELFSEDLW